MRKIQTTRRSFLKYSTGTVGALAVPIAIAMPSTDTDTEDALVREQNAFLKTVLHKHVKRSKPIHRKHVDAFAQRFSEIHGVVDYRQKFSGLAGEYRLTRLFVRSLHATGVRS